MIVTEYIHKNELTQKQKDKFTPGGNGMWNERPFGRAVGPRIYQIYLPENTDIDYLTKKKGKLTVESAHEEDVKDNVIIHCLGKKLKNEQGLIYGLAKDIPKELIVIDRIHAKVLMQLFLKKEMPLYYSDNREFYEVYDEKNKRIIKENLNRKWPKVGTDNLLSIGEENEVKGLKKDDQHSQPNDQINSETTMQFDIDGMYDCVVEFLVNIKEGFLLEALENWTPLRRQELWEGDLNQFSKAWNFYISIKNIKVWNFHRIEYSAKSAKGFCLCFYESVSLVNDGHAGAFELVNLQNIDDIRASVLKHVESLSDPELSEFISRWEYFSQVQERTRFNQYVRVPKEMPEYFPKYHEITQYNIKEIKLDRLNGKWLLDNIEDFQGNKLFHFNFKDLGVNPLYDSINTFLK